MGAVCGGHGLGPSSVYLGRNGRDQKLAEIFIYMIIVQTATRKQTLIVLWPLRRVWFSGYAQSVSGLVFRFPRQCSILMSVYSCFHDRTVPAYQRWST
jgi:hypothetical protein